MALESSVELLKVVFFLFLPQGKKKGQNGAEEEKPHCCLWKNKTSTQLQRQFCC